MTLIISRLFPWTLLTSCLFWAGCQAPAPMTMATGSIATISDEDRFVDHALETLRDNFFTPDFVDRNRGLIVTRPETSKQWFEFWRSDAPAGYQLLESSLHTVRRKVTIAFVPTDPTTRVAGWVEANTQQQMQSTRSGAAPTASRPPTGMTPMTPVNRGPAPPRSSSPPATSTPGKSVAPSQPRPAAPPRITAPPPAVPPSRPKPYRVTVTVDKERLSAPERQVTTVSGGFAIFSQRTPTTEGLRPTRAEGEYWIPVGRDGEMEQRLLARLMSNPVVSDRRPLPPAATPTSPPTTTRPPTAPPPRPSAPPPQRSSAPGQMQQVR